MKLIPLDSNKKYALSEDGKLYELKEVNTQSLLGAVYTGESDNFGQGLYVGDIVEVNGVKGEVIDFREKYGHFGIMGRASYSISQLRANYGDVRKITSGS